MKAPPAAQSSSAPPKTFNEGNLYAFISYARPDQAVAEKGETFLKAAGVRVFRWSCEKTVMAFFRMSRSCFLESTGQFLCPPNSSQFTFGLAFGWHLSLYRKRFSFAKSAKVQGQAKARPDPSRLMWKELTNGNSR